MKTLKDTKPGETVTLVKYHETGDVDLRRHLLGMGFVKGAKITVKKVATLGDPIEMSVKGYDVCLRKEEAENIEVKSLQFFIIFFNGLFLTVLYHEMQNVRFRI